MLDHAGKPLFHVDLHGKVSERRHLDLGIMPLEEEWESEGAALCRYGSLPLTITSASRRLAALIVALALCREKMNPPCKFATVVTPVQMARPLRAGGESAA